MRISDWSSDVCSSDLRDIEREGIVARIGHDKAIAGRAVAVVGVGEFSVARIDHRHGAVLRQRRKVWTYRIRIRIQAERVTERAERNEIGRASCRERVCQYV